MPLVILGAGGHARVLLSALALSGDRPIGCVSIKVPDTQWPEDIPYLGDDKHLSGLDTARFFLVNGRGSVGVTHSRRRLYIEAKRLGFSFVTIVHPSAIISEGVQLGEGVQAMAGAVVQTGGRLGANVLVNTGAIIDHDCMIDAHCHIATGARLSGDVTLNEGVHVGSGASIIQGVRVGSEAIIGAGAVVIRDVPAGVCVVGNPARVLRAASEVRNA